MRHVFIAIIRLYQLVVSPHIRRSCRYHPTCSHYAIEALREHGFFKGGIMAFRRILRCHPWSSGGFDPVPESSEQKSERLKTS